MKKRVLLFCILSIIFTLLLASCGGSSDAGNVVYGDGLKFIGNGDGTCRVAGFENAAIANVVIPSTSPAGDTVTSIGYRAFSESSGVVSVTIPDSVTSIAKQAFYGCSGLASVIIPDSVASIGDGAFSDCTSLKTVSIGKKMKIIGESAFSGCYALEKVEISDIVKWFGIAFGNEDANPLCNAHNLYLNGTLLTDITTPDGTASVTKYAFYGCSCLENLTIGNSVKNIGVSAFGDCLGIETVKIGDSVKSIDQSAFAGCVKLEKIEIPDSVTNIGNSAFSDCAELSEVVFGNGVSTIGQSAFYSCIELKNIVVPDSVTSIGDDAFSGCAELTTVSIGKGVTSIGSSAFYGCSGLINLTFAEDIKLKSIGDLAFAYCTELSGVEIPKNVTKIGDKAFRDCVGLMSVSVADGNFAYRAEGNCLIKLATKSIVLGCQNSVIPTDGSVSAIGAYAFQGCSGLTSISIPKSVNSIGDSAFSGCIGLESVYIEDLAAWCGISFRNVTANPLGYAHDLYLNGELIDVISIPEGTKRISKYAFYGCSGLSGVNITDLSAWCKISFGDYHANPLYYAHDLYIGGEPVTELVVPDGITGILSYAFAGCTGITNVSIPESVTIIDTHAFYGCSGLKNVEMPKNLLTIGSASFYDCTDLLSINIPKSVVNIGYEAFFNCPKLENITVETGNTVYHSNGNCLIKTGSKSLILGCKNSVIPTDGSVIMLGTSAFAGCEELRNVSIPKSIKNISGGVFAGCFGLESVYITDLAAWCDISFGNATSNPLYYAHNLYLNGELVTDLVLSDDVTSINSYAFYGWYDLKNITIGRGVKNIGSSAFIRCENIESINVAKENANYCSENNCLIKKSTKTLILGCKNSIIPTDGSVVGIGSSAFNSCVGLTSISIPSSIKAMAGGAFERCEGLERVDITDISAWCGISFGSNSANPLNCAHKLYLNGELVTELVVPNSVKSISKYAFLNCSDLESVSIGNGVKSIGASVFEGCEKLVSITVDKENAAYRSECNCLIRTATKSLILGCKNSVIPTDGSITSIGKSAFSGCAELKEITIPKSVVSIGSDAFYGCTGLEKLEINDVSAWCGVSFENVYANPLHYAGNLYLNGEEVVDLVIPNSVKRIAKYAFYGCSAVETITIGSGVKSIGQSAFGNCEKLVSITVADGNTIYRSEGNNLIKIANKTLILGCKTSVIPTDGSVVVIGQSAFAGCSELNEIAIPKSIKKIGAGAFAECVGLTKVDVADIAAWCGISFVDAEANPLYNAHVISVDGEIKTEIVIPDGVKTISKYAFAGCSDITSVTIGSGVKSIREHAFEDCTGITAINYGGTVAKWKAITKGSSWDNNTGDYTVYCTDGTITK